MFCESVEKKIFFFQLESFIATPSEFDEKQFFLTAINFFDFFNKHKTDDILDDEDIKHIFMYGIL